MPQQDLNGSRVAPLHRGGGIRQNPSKDTCTVLHRVNEQQIVHIIPFFIPLGTILLLEITSLWSDCLRELRFLFLKTRAASTLPCPPCSHLYAAR